MTPPLGNKTAEETLNKNVSFVGLIQNPIVAHSNQVACIPKTEALKAMEEYASTVVKEAVKEKEDLKRQVNNWQLLHDLVKGENESKGLKLYAAQKEIDSLHKDLEYQAQAAHINADKILKQEKEIEELKQSFVERRMVERWFKERKSNSGDLNLRVEEEKINLWQNNPSVHPLTCGNDSRHTPLLTKQVDGKTILYCKDCDYIQNYIPSEVGDTEKTGEDEDDYFYCTERHKVGSVCEEQCKRCKRADDFEPDVN